MLLFCCFVLLFENQINFIAFQASFFLVGLEVGLIVGVSQLCRCLITGHEGCTAYTAATSHDRAHTHARTHANTHICGSVLEPKLPLLEPWVKKLTLTWAFPRSRLVLLLPAIYFCSSSTNDDSIWLVHHISEAAFVGVQANVCKGIDIYGGKHEKRLRLM